MSSFGVFNRQVRRIGVLVALLVATIVPALVPSLVAAATVTERSISLSSSSKSATGVTYRVSFKPVVDADAFVVDFCSDTPIIGQSCTAPTGMVTSSATSSTSGFTDVAAVTNGGSHNTLRVVSTTTMTAGVAVTVDLEGITNPSTTDPLYARIVTYDGGSATATTSANGYTSVNPDAAGTHKDDGGVAISITDTVGVSGAVLESMTFCAASVTITQDCGDANTHLPTLKLGETVGGTVALVPGTTSTGDIYTQISTNAASGATVWLKSGVACGGLKRLEVATCDITPSVDGISAADAEFGVKTAASTTDTGSNASGTYQATNGYNSSTYLLNWISGNATGVSSAYGDQILNTANAPVNNKNMKLTFGAQINNSTPAGLYSADLSLIATGKF
jgi:hypothetical protein